MVVQQIACVRLQWLVPVCILSSVLPVYVAEAPASPGIVLFGTRLHKRELERTMYPTIHSNSGVGSSTQYAGHSDPSSANGPLQLSRSISNSNTLPVLRVHVADHLSISPPVRLSWLLAFPVTFGPHLPASATAAGHD